MTPGGVGPTEGAMGYPPNPTIRHPSKRRRLRHLPDPPLHPLVRRRRWVDHPNHLRERH